MDTLITLAKTGFTRAAHVAAALALLWASPAHAVDGDLAETLEVQFTSPAAAPLAAKAAELASPVAIYEYVSNNSEFTLYYGARSGSTNSFVGKRGNDVDLAATLIAMLRSRGIPARYAVGNVRMASGALASWLGVKNVKLAVYSLQDAGIQQVALSADGSSVDLEHVWVEALVPYAYYRGAGQPGVSCAVTPTACTWVSLDPSYQQRVIRSSGLDPVGTSAVKFNYDAYYDATLNNDATLREKNPLEIFENQLLDWLQANAPGKTLEDIPDVLGVVRREAGLLPASLPYTVVGPVRRYGSIADHDAVVPWVETKPWTQYLRIKTKATAYAAISGGAANVDLAPIPLVRLTSERLTITSQLNGTVPEIVIRLGGTELQRPIRSGAISGYTPAAGDPFLITMTMDAAPAYNGTSTDLTVVARHEAVIGGYYLVATGGETSNWGQVHAAAAQLLDANDRYKIVYNTAEAGCLPASGIKCTPYVDANGNGWDSTDPRLSTQPAALDALTGGLLDVAGKQYCAELRDVSARLDALMKIKTPLQGFVGVLTTTQAAEYVDGTAFAIQPGGLLIDITFHTTGDWLIDQPATHSETHLKLLGHAASSLEHEIWQKLTGYDSISTVRGIQIARANGIRLQRPTRKLATEVGVDYSAFGFGTTWPPQFTKAERSIYGTSPVTWSHATQDYTQTFTILQPTPTGVSDPRRDYIAYTNGTHHEAITCFIANQNELAKYPGSTVLAAGNLCLSSYPTGTTIAQAIAQNQRDYTTYQRDYVGQYRFDFMDKGKGFLPLTMRYRMSVVANNDQPTGVMDALRDAMWFDYLDNGTEVLRDLTKTWVGHVLPTKLSTGPGFRFSVGITSTYDMLGGSVNVSYWIFNETVAGNGGWVTAPETFLMYDPSTGGLYLVPFDNAVFTDMDTISIVNNDVYRTPSTADPVSTVTGNNYHDETDVVIRGRGLHYALTRTYNSAKSSTSKDGPLGYGWTHSYAMRVTSNDYGICPNCDPGTGDGKRPENGTGKTSSITYTDERGGEHNYLVDETTLAVTSPKGEFSVLALDTPATGQHTLTFRNGTRYVFEVVGGAVLKTTPNVVARLMRIADPWGAQLDLAYDANGRLSTVTDNLGVPGRTGLAFSYDGSGHLSSVRDWTNRTWRYSVSAAGDLVSFTNPLLQATRYTYAPGTHELFEIVKPLKRAGNDVKTAFRYYENGRTFDYANALGEAETLDYDLFRRTTRVTDPRGGVREYQYDGSGQLTKLVEPDGAVLRFASSADGLRYQKSDELGYRTRYSYRTDGTFGTATDTGGNVTREEDPAGKTVDLTYGPYDQVKSVKDKRGTVRTTTFHATTDGICALTGKPDKSTLSSLSGTTNVTLAAFCWNADGTLKSRTDYIVPGSTLEWRRITYSYDPGGVTVSQVVLSGSDGSTVTQSFGYDALGRKTSETSTRRASPSDASLLTLTTRSSYDALDRVTVVQDAIGNLAQTVYDANGQIESIVGHYKQPDGSLVTRTLSARVYDAADRLVETRDVIGESTRFAYDESGNLVAATDPNGHVTRYEYDAMNRRTAVVDANGHRTETTYDLGGRVVAVTNAAGEVARSEYDALGNLVKVTDGKGYVTELRYDANGNRYCTIDANAQAGLQPKNAHACTEYREFDELGRTVLVEDARNGQTKMAFDLLGRMTSLTDAELKTTAFHHDTIGRLRWVKDPLGMYKLFERDEAGNAWQVTDREGQVTRITYDLLNRPVRYEFVNDATSEMIAYDPYGNRQSVSNGAVSYTFEYDLRNRLKRKIDSRSGRQLAFTYDDAGNVLSKTDYQGDVTTFQYDSTNRLVGMSNKAYTSARYQYDAAGRLLTRNLSNGARSEYTWDANGWLASLTTLSANGTVLSSVTYGRDRVGNLVDLTDATGLTHFTYDALHRLTNANYATGNDEAFTYDKVGNRLTHDDGLLHSYEYLPSSNRLWKVHTGPVTGPVEKAFTWDMEGRLKTQTGGIGAYAASITWDQKNRATSMTSSLGTTTTFQYDPDDLRIGRSGGSLGARSYYLEGEHLEAEYSGTVLQTEYFRGIGTDELVAGKTLEGGTLTPAVYHHDPLMSVTAVSTADGQLRESARYGAFGDLRAATGSSPNRLRFTGRELDADTQLYYNRARYYDPTIGRFISEDPIGFSGGVNFYAYAGNNPVNSTDPSGQVALVDNAVAGLINVGIGWGITCLLESCGDYSLGRAALDFGIGFATNGLSAIAAARRLANVGNGVKNLAGRQLAEAAIADRGWTVAGEEVYTRVTTQYVDDVGDLVTRVYNPRVDFIVRTEEGLIGVEAKYGPEAALTYAQEFGYPLINEGASNVMYGTAARGAELAGEGLLRVEQMAFYEAGYGTLANSLPGAIGADLVYQSLVATPAMAAGEVPYPSAGDTVYVLAVYLK